MVIRMQERYFRYMKTLSNVLLLIVFASCSSVLNIIKDETVFVSETKKTFCTNADKRNNKFEEYDQGDLPCLKYKLKVSSSGFLEIEYVTLNENAADIYDRGYQILKRFKNEKVIERIKLRKNKDAYWDDTPFVRIRKQKYFSDLDGDGYIEFAIYPFSSGSAVVGTVRIFSLKNKIEFWGNGRYQFEGDTFVQLNCPRWSKFNPDEEKNCR